MTTPEENKALVRRFIDALGSGDVAGAAACFDAERYYSHAWEGDLAVTWEKMKARRREQHVHRLGDARRSRSSPTATASCTTRHQPMSSTLRPARESDLFTSSRSGASRTASSSSTGAGCASTSDFSEQLG